MFMKADPPGKKTWVMVCVIVLGLLAALPAWAQEERAGRKRGHEGGAMDLEKILDGLERGLVALDELDRREELEMLRRVADEVRERMKRGGDMRRGEEEREGLRHQIEIMKMAMPALREAERKDTAELLEHAIHARELTLEGRRDPEAAKIRESAPKLGAQAEILMFAADLWKKYGDLHKAEVVGDLGRELLTQWKRGREGRARKEDAGSDREREIAKEQIRIMEAALPALKEAGKEDAADLLKRMIQARIARLEGHRGPEADSVREREPKPATQVEILSLASKLWQDYGHEKKAAEIGKLADQMRAKLERGRAGGEEARAEKLGQLEQRIAELKAVMEDLEAELRGMKRRER